MLVQRCFSNLSSKLGVRVIELLLYLSRGVCAVRHQRAALILPFVGSSILGRLAVEIDITLGICRDFSSIVEESQAL